MNSIESETLTVHPYLRGLWFI